MRWLGILGGMVGLAACGDRDADSASEDEIDPRVADVMALTPDADDGVVVYDALCVSCHFADGTGPEHKPMNEVLTKITQERTIEIVLYGDVEMEGQGDVMTDQEAADVVEYIRTEFIED